jgi:hypothetical protein
MAKQNLKDIEIKTQIGKLVVTINDMDEDGFEVEEVTNEYGDVIYFDGMTIDGVPFDDYIAVKVDEALFEYEESEE